MDLPQLRDILVAYFNDNELRDLCFDLGIDYENLGGDAKSGKARELVDYCRRYDRLPDLEAACRRLRPNAFKDSSSASAESATTSKAEERPGSTVINRSGGVTINAQTVNITGDVVGRDKKSSSSSDTDLSSSQG
jgi:hypothetical protein